jgi:hypothetical protein
MRWKRAAIGFVCATLAVLTVVAYATDKNAKCLPIDQQAQCWMYATAWVSQTPCPKTLEGDNCMNNKCFVCDSSTGPWNKFSYCIVVDDENSSCTHGTESETTCGKQKRYDCIPVTEPPVSCRCPHLTELALGGTPLPDTCKVYHCNPQ